MISVNSDFRTIKSGIELPDGDFNIFVGPNNSGKSNVLLYVNQHFGNDCDYVSPQRLNVSNTIQFLENPDNQFGQWRDSRKNKGADISEIQGPNPTQELAALDNTNIDRLLKWHKEYFAHIEEKRDNDHRYKMPQILIEGRKPSEQGSGSRAVFSLLVKLFDPRLKVLCIDEPEISVDPQIQRKLFQLIKYVALGVHNLPKKKIFIATHSHLFVDKETIKNNHYVIKQGEWTQIFPIKDEKDLHDIVFRLLGNSPADIFFPSNVLVVEGESDFIFLSKVISLFPDSIKRRGLCIHYADGDSKVAGATKSLDQMLKTASYIPLYRDKLCVLFDKQDSDQYVNEVKTFLDDINGERVKELPKKGIEYFYPTSSITAISGIIIGFDGEIAKFLEETRSNHEGIGKLGSFSGTKIDLAKRVITENWGIDAVDQIIRGFIEKALSAAFE